ALPILGEGCQPRRPARCIRRRFRGEREAIYWPAGGRDVNEQAKPYWDDSRIEEIVSARSKILGPSVWAAARPDAGPIISFAGGLPDSPSLPGKELLRAARTVIDREQKEALEYGGTFGTTPLREVIAERSSKLEGIPVT